MNKALLLIAFAAPWVSTAYAERLGTEGASELSTQIRRDRADLEKKLREARKKTDRRAEEEKKFRAKQIADKIAFDRSIAGKPLSEQRSAHSAYVAGRLEGERKHAEKQKKFAAVGAEMAAEREDARKKSLKRLKEAYS